MNQTKVMQRVPSARGDTKYTDRTWQSAYFNSPRDWSDAKRTEHADKVWAIKIAKGRVYMHRFGRGQWVVNVYDPERRAWWQGNPTEWNRAKGAYREYLIREALDALEIEDADYEANRLAEASGKWDVLVRKFVAAAGVAA